MGCVSASDPIMRQCSGERNGRGGEGRRVGGRSGPQASVEVLPHKAVVSARGEGEGVGGRKGRGEVWPLPQSKFCPTRQTSALPRPLKY